MTASKMSRKAYNHAVANAARKAGVYALVMANWGMLDRSLTPSKSVKVLTVLLDGSEPAKVATKKASAKKPVKVAPEAAAPLESTVAEIEEVEVDVPASQPFAAGKYTQTLTVLKIRAAIEAGLDVPVGNWNKGECGSAYPAIRIDARTKAAKVIKEAGYEFHNGVAFVHLPSEGQGLEAHNEQAWNVARELRMLFAKCGLDMSAVTVKSYVD